MRTIEHSTRFRRDYKREKRGVYRSTLDNDVLSVVRLLAMDLKLPTSMRDHTLAGDLKDCRDCHIKPDLVLIYRKTGARVLELIRLGSHSELGL